MNEQAVREIIGRIEGLPPLPAVVTRLCELSGDPDADVREITRVVSTDQALTARVLCVTNSAFFGLSQRITTLSQAAVILGSREAWGLAIGLALGGLEFADARVSPANRDEFWRHSFAAAGVCRMLGRQLGLADGEEAYVGGLIHDIGKLVFMAYFPDEYAKVLARVSADEGPVVSLEEEMLGMDHASLGARLCRHWNMPSSLIRAVELHHEPAPETMLVDGEAWTAAIIRVADSITRIAGIGSGGDPHLERNSLKLPGVTIPLVVFHQVLLGLAKEVRKAEALFDLNRCGSELNEAAHPRGNTAALLVADRDAATVVSVMLLAMGYSSVPCDGVARGNSPGFAGVVFDRALPAALKDFCSHRGIPALDLKQWLDGDAAASFRCIHAGRLRKWLETGLRPQPVPIDRLRAPSEVEDPERLG